MVLRKVSEGRKTGTGRGEKRHRQSVPAEVGKVVEALCADYDRREKAIQLGTARAEALRHYRYLNEAIREALLSVCSEEDMALLLKDISWRRSRTRSPQCRVHPTTYAELKRRAKFAVARRLRFL